MEIEIQKLIDEFASDRHSGSSELAVKALVILKKVANCYEGTDLLNNMTRTGLTLISSQSSMAVIINLVNKVLLEVERLNSQGDFQLIGESITDIKQKFSSASSIAIAHTVVQKSNYRSIATYSRSSLVEKALIRMVNNNPDINILLSESRPGNEGITLAKKLMQFNGKVTICVDAAMPLLMERADCLLIGADMISYRGFVNKIGTNILCRTAELMDIPVYILATTYKFLSKELQRFFQIKDYPGELFLDLDSDDISIFNQQFEWCELDPVKGIITELGNLPVIEIFDKIEAFDTAECLKEGNK